MAFLHIKNVKISGLAAGVPSTVVDNADLIPENSKYSIDDFVENTGIRSKHFSKVLTTSDLCFNAAERLISDLKWNKNDIGAIVFVSQNPDYLRPATACILQARLKLNKECAAYDIVFGCSGWVYGLCSLSSLMQSGDIKKALLMVGDAKEDHHDLLAGHAGTVTALEYQENNNGMYFHLGTNGDGWNAICIPDGGSRNPFSLRSLESIEIDGHKRCRLNSIMKGMDVFSFGISIAPKSIKSLADHFSFDYQAADYLVLHQANKKMNELIVKKLNFDPLKVPSSMYEFGNTSSSSIPLTIISQLKGKIESRKVKFVCCGFGVGLSWGTVAFAADGIKLSQLVLVDDEQIDEKYIYKI